VGGSGGEVVGAYKIPCAIGSRFEVKRSARACARSMTVALVGRRGIACGVVGMSLVFGLGGLVYRASGIGVWWQDSRLAVLLAGLRCGALRGGELGRLLELLPASLPAGLSIAAV
jgi:hypothetical protein